MDNEFFNYLLLSGPVCGIIMVLGGILLLYKGAITLSASPENALTVEFRRVLRITTQYPALGIFVIGLLFVAVPAILGRPATVKPVTITANTVGMAEPVSIVLRAASWSTNLKHIGSIVETHRPFVDTVQILVTAPGHAPLRHAVQLSELNNGMIDLGDIKLEQKISKDILENNIAPVADGIKLPGLDAKVAFGGAK